MNDKQKRHKRKKCIAYKGQFLKNLPEEDMINHDAPLILVWFCSSLHQQKYYPIVDHTGGYYWWEPPRFGMAADRLPQLDNTQSQMSVQDGDLMFSYHIIDIKYISDIETVTLESSV